jgi:hypothetical protein
MMNSSAVQLARAYRSIGCSWAKIGTKFGISRRKIQKLLELEAPSTQAAFSSPSTSARSQIGTGKEA